jgi:hypothetical protein
MDAPGILVPQLSHRRNHLMRVRTTLIIVRATIFSAALGLLSHSETQSLSEATWSLPHGLTVRDAGPRTYRFTVDYNSANSKGDIF